MIRSISLLVWLAACTPDAQDVVPTPIPIPTPPATVTPELPPVPDEPAFYADLRALPGVTLVGTRDTYDGATAVSLVVLQPVDHADPTGPGFEQWITLRHRDDAAPMVLLTSGYDDSYGHNEEELSYRLQANQISVEKRTFPLSRPVGPIDWTTLTVEQIAADQHRLVEVFRPLYPGPWIGHGGSQGGIDTLQHHRLFPDDLVGTVALVPPLVDRLDDPRALPFFAEVDPACMADLYAIRRAVLDPAGLRPQAEADASSYLPPVVTFDRVGGLSAAFEMYVVEFPWYFWQYNPPELCDTLPDPAVDPQGAIDTALWFWAAQNSDQDLEVSGSYWYQIAHHVGYPTMPQDELDGLLTPGLPAQWELIPVDAAPPEFESFAPELQAWLLDEADHVVLTYGGLDPWTAMRADVEGAVGDVHAYTAPLGNHNTTLATLDLEDHAEAWDVVTSWIP